MFRNYLAAALRNLARNRFYAAVNISGLAVGFCAALLIVLFVRSEYSYDRFFPGYRDVYLVTSYREAIDRRLTPDPQDTSFPDLAVKLSGQFRQIETVARVTPAMNPPHIPVQLFAASSVVAVAIALLTVSAHCWRVARAKPMRALRYE